MSDQPTYKWTVYYRIPTAPAAKPTREDFTDKQPAIDRVNALLRRGFRAWLRPYVPPKRAIDYIAERGQR